MSPLELILLVNSYSFALPDGLLVSVSQVETQSRNIHVMDKGSMSYGPCQIKYRAAKQMGFPGKAKELRNPVVSSYYAAAYLRYQIDRNHGNIKKAVIAYNQGSAKGLTSTVYQRKVFKVWRGGNYEF